MPVFTYVASIIVAEVIGIAGAAILGSAGVAFVTSAIALGLATITSRLINGAGGGDGGTQQNPGVRIQFPPATNNKIPIVYGSANTKGVITDARLGNSNKTMTYLLVLSEKTATGTFTIGDIFWNDQKLVFRAGAESHIVASSIDQNGFGTESTNYNGLIRMYVYAGGVDSTKQIFPTGGTAVNARTLLDESDTNYVLNELVFAVVQVDFSSEKGTTGLGQLTFQVNNTLKNPGDVWYDYVTNSRYGAGFTATSINTVTSIGSTSTSLKSLSDTIPSNQYLADGVTSSTQVRYEINGVLSTGDVVKNNIDKICMSSACWTTYDFMQGKWKVIPNRAATATELANAFVFNDDNIIGDITVNATSLEDLYNSIQVEFASRKIRDQNDYYNAVIDPAERNTLEPDNALNLRLELCNNALHSGRIGLIELKQSRIDLIISFTAYHVALEVQAGDVVKITNDIFDFAEKLFRVTKTREMERDDGSITIEITALEYDADVYTDESLSDTAQNTGSGIVSFTSSLPAPTRPHWDTTPNTTSTHSVDIFDGAVTPYFRLHSEVSSGSLPVANLEYFISTNTSTGFTSLVSMSGNFTSGSASTSSNITGVAAGTYYFQARTGIGNRQSAFSTSSIALVWNPQPGRDQGVI